MKKSRQNSSDRLAQLIGLLKQRGYCSVVEMSQLLNVSPMTIRRDLHMLHEKQIVEVTYGGARFIASKRSEPDFDIRAREHLAEKQAIGKRAAELFIEEGDVLGMDSSKIGRAYLARFATLNAIDTLITDNGISDESREVIEQQQIQIITVSTEIPASLPELVLTRDDVAV